MQKIYDCINVSIDDVNQCLRWIYENEPDSIFDTVFFSKLRSWHTLYGLCFEMFVFEKWKGFSIEMLPDRYWMELRENATWIKMVWHGISGDKISYSDDEKIISIDRVYSLVVGKASKDLWGSRARLHSWEGSEQVLERLQDSGCNTFLTADSNRTSYDLDYSESEKISLYGEYKKNGRIYVETAVRLDGFSNGMTFDDIISICDEKLSKGRDRIEVFFHEWSFMSIFNDIDILLSNGVVK